MATDLLSTTIANNSPTIDIALIDGNLYSEYQIIFHELTAGLANTKLNARFSDDGTIFHAANYAWTLQNIFTTPASAVTGAFNAAQIEMSAANFQADERKAAAGEIHIFPSASGTAFSNMQWTLQYTNQAQTSFNFFRGAATCKVAAVPAAIRLFFTPATTPLPTIHLGTFQLFGLRK